MIWVIFGRSKKKIKFGMMMMRITNLETTAFPRLLSFAPARFYTAFAFARRPRRRNSFLFTTSCSTDVSITIATDHNYGNKQVISVTQTLYDYLLTNVREPPVITSLSSPTIPTKLIIYISLPLARKKN